MRGRLSWHHSSHGVSLYHKIPYPGTIRSCLERSELVAVAAFDRKFDRWECNMSGGGFFFGATCFEVLTIAATQYRMEGGAT